MLCVKVGRPAYNSRMILESSSPIGQAIRDHARCAARSARRGSGLAVAALFLLAAELAATGRHTELEACSLRVMVYRSL